MKSSSTSDSLTADDIRRQMYVVRHRMSHEAAGVADGARQLTDWRFYVQNFTGPILAACAVLGYALVPAKKGEPDSLRRDRADSREEHSSAQAASRPAAAKAGFANTLLTSAGNLVLRAALAYAGQQVAQAFKPDAPQPQESAS
jgi:hypothetical protein